jgi:uncharacterized MAPEG superfamily protein
MPSSVEGPGRRHCDSRYGILVTGSNAVAETQCCGWSVIAMTGDLWALAAAMLLATLQLTLSSVLTLRQLGGAWVAGSRDEPREVTGVSGRFVRAYRNLLEIFPQFVAALFLVHAAHAAGSLSVIGAWMFVIARLLYVPAYAFAAPGVRPICWLAAQMGIFTILADLFV